MTEYKRVCKVCGDEFTTDNKNQIYCHKLCRWRSYYAAAAKRRYKHSRKDLTAIATMVIESYLKEYGNKKYLTSWAVADHGFNENLIPTDYSTDKIRRAMRQEIPKFGYECIRKKSNPLFIRTDLKDENPSLVTECQECVETS